MSSSSQLLTSIKRFAREYSRYTADSFIRYAKSQDLSPTQLGTLLHLSRDKGQGVAGIGDSMCVTSAAASQMIDRLVLSGFVERSENDEDRRSKRVRLTDKGSAVVEGFGETRYAWIDSLEKRFTEEESRIVQAALEIVTEKSKNLDKENLYP